MPLLPHGERQGLITNKSKRNNSLCSVCLSRYHWKRQPVSSKYCFIENIIVQKQKPFDIIIPHGRISQNSMPVAPRYNI